MAQTLLPPVANPRKTVTVGVAMVEEVQQANIGWSVCGGALSLAIDYLHMQNYLLDVDFNFYFNYTECDPARAVAVGMDFVQNKNVDAIIGPPCFGGTYIMGLLTNLYEKYMITWGYVSDSSFSSMDKFPYLTTMMPSSNTLAYAVIKVFERFEWDRYSFLYTDDDVNYCKGMLTSIRSIMALNTTYLAVMAYYAELLPDNPVAYVNILTTAKTRSRIIVVCFNSPSEIREFMYRATENGMATGEFVFLVLSLMSTGFGQIGNGTVKLASGLTPFWIDLINGNADNKDLLAKEGAKRAIVLDMSSKVLDTSWMSVFNNEVLERVREPPISCSTSECLNNTHRQPGGYARQLHDAMYLYGISLSSAMARDPVNGYRNAGYLQDGVQVKVNGLTGVISMNANTTRDPYYYAYYLDEKAEENTFLNITVTNNSAQLNNLFADESTTIWATRGGARPLSRPICGFSGTECPHTFMDVYFIYIVVGSPVVLVLIITALVVIAFAIRSKHQFMKMQRAECQIANSRLENQAAKLARKSKRSLTSNATENTVQSYAELDQYEVYTYDKDQVIVSLHEPSTLTENDYNHFVKLRKLDHPNLNPFIGISVDRQEFKVVWKYCSRSSLYNIISEGHMSTMDSFFIYSVIKDTVEGLAFLHRSFIRCHGRLYSGCCLVNEGWQVKITDHGISALKPSKRMGEKGDSGAQSQLWVAPEHLRQPGTSSPAGDIYSFAIIASEVINRKSPFNYKEREEGLDELIFLIRKGGARPIRPEFNATDAEVSSALMSSIRDCWSEDPGERPTAEIICKTINSLMPKENGNLIDHVFAKMEEYTKTLEMEVEDRTKELVAEKKKADTLLSKMLPRQVAEKLKLGQTVEPEGFDSVSVLFMDIVKFTQLSHKCSPLQVVSLLNELFTNFDEIIERQGVYKVESIGDGYLCVSGLPIRNGFRHIREIVEMAIVLLKYVKEFKISHLSRERVELRIGINSGPCVAGVVGLAMPRYCLFGDTVNTASRMESNGKASLIHLSEAAHSLLIANFGGCYRTESRGEVFIKGKGAMETFWVLGRMYRNPSANTATPPLSPLPGETAIKIEEENEEEAILRQYTRPAAEYI